MFENKMQSHFQNSFQITQLRRWAITRDILLAFQANSMTWSNTSNPTNYKNIILYALHFFWWVTCNYILNTSRWCGFFFNILFLIMAKMESRIKNKFLHHFKTVVDLYSHYCTIYVSAQGQINKYVTEKTDWIYIVMKTDEWTNLPTLTFSW